MSDAITQPGSGDQRHRIGDDVAGDYELKVRTRGVQVELDRRRGDVDDVEVDDGHQLGGEHDEEDEGCASGWALITAGASGPAIASNDLCRAANARETHLEGRVRRGHRIAHGR